jgi:pimeloyl-ACP methyl ester carboxylesterase
VFQLLHHLFTAAHRRNLSVAGANGEVPTEDHYRFLESGWLEISETWGARPAPFFPRPQPPQLRLVRRTRLPGGWCEDLELSSDHAPGRATARRMRKAHPGNALAPVRLYRHSGTGHPALMWIHGWGMGDHRLEAAVCRARALYRLGLDVYLYVQPYHASRRPPGTLFAGMLYPSTHLDRTNEAFLQTIWEIRSLVAWHRHRGGGPAGVMGLSLGGYVAAVAASVADELAFAVSILPLADVPALMWSNGDGTPDRLRAEAEGVTFDDFCRSMAIHGPLARGLAIPRDRLLLVGARGDRIIPPVHTEVLWEHWGRPRLCWIPGSHVMQFGRHGYLTAAMGLLKDLELIP